jgi:hypothetical protein
MNISRVLMNIGKSVPNKNSKFGNTSRRILNTVFYTGLYVYIGFLSYLVYKDIYDSRESTKRVNDAWKRMNDNKNQNDV